MIVSPTETISSLARQTVLDVWDATTGDQLEEVRVHSKGIASVAVFPEGDQIITGSVDKTATVWDATTGDQLDVF